MAALARTETVEQRGAIYAALHRRNRVVAILRFGLPAIGVALLAGLLLQLFVGSITPDFGFANVRFDRENLVVEAPNYSGIGAGGAAYSVTAGSARAAIDNTDLVHLTDATFEVEQPSGASFEARAREARVEVAAQLVTVDGETHVAGSNGITGTVVGAHIDLVAEQMVSDGAADLTLANGTRVQSESMTFDSKAQLWTFRRATVTLPSMPGTTADAAGNEEVGP